MCSRTNANDTDGLLQKPRYCVRLCVCTNYGVSTRQMEMKASNSEQLVLLNIMNGQLSSCDDGQKNSICNLNILDPRSPSHFQYSEIFLLQWGRIGHGLD